MHKQGRTFPERFCVRPFLFVRVSALRKRKNQNNKETVILNFAKNLSVKVSRSAVTMRIKL